MDSGGDYGSGPGPVDCASYNTRTDCSSQCFWCDDTKVCVLHWPLCEPPPVGPGGASTVLVPLLVLALVLGGGALLCSRCGDGSAPLHGSVLAREGFEVGATGYRRGHYAGIEEEPAAETELVAYPPPPEGQRLLSGSM